MPSAYQVHYDKWKDCKLCRLAECRRKVVIVRGDIPSPVLFVGEAPGASENLIGVPFKGPAGHLMDRMIHGAGMRPGSYALTNLVCCIPLDDYSNKVSDPPAFAITACAGRLIETAKLCKPQLIIWVGEVSAKWGPTLLPMELIGHTHQAKIIHPGAIIRMDISQQALAAQRAVAAIRGAVEEAGL